MTKDKKIEANYEKLAQIFANLDEDKKIFADKLCRQLAFMDNTLDELQDKIKTEGAITEGINGNGFNVLSEHPAQKSYNAMIKNYNSTIKALTDLLPEDDKDSDELLDFISGGK